MQLKYFLDVKTQDGQYKGFYKLFNSENHLYNYIRVLENNGTKVIGTTYIGKI